VVVVVVLHLLLPLLDLVVGLARQDEREASTVVRKSDTLSCREHGRRRC
jgi:hypothetical protein